MLHSTDLILHTVPLNKYIAQSSLVVEALSNTNDIFVDLQWAGLSTLIHNELFSYYELNMVYLLL